MPKFENPKVPPSEVPPSGPYSDIERASGQFTSEANYRNKERTFWDKALGRKKVRKEDVARGYAELFETYVDEETGGDKSKEPEVIAKWHMLQSPSMAASTYGHSIDVGAFSKSRDLWSTATEGQLTAEQMNKWPEVQGEAKWEIAYHADRDGAADFVKYRDTWVQAGVITPEVANKLAAVVEKAKWEIKYYAKRDKAGLEKNIANWVAASVVDEVTARSWAQNPDERAA